MLTNRDDSSNENPTPWTALILSTFGAIIVIETTSILVDAWWKSHDPRDMQFQAAVGQIRAYFTVGVTCFAAGICLLVGRWKTGWALLIISCGFLLWSLPDK